MRIQKKSALFIHQIIRLKNALAADIERIMTLPNTGDYDTAALAAELDQTIRHFVLREVLGIRINYANDIYEALSKSFSVIDSKTDHKITLISGEFDFVIISNRIDSPDDSRVYINMHPDRIIDDVIDECINCIVNNVIPILELEYKKFMILTAAKHLAHWRTLNSTNGSKMIEKVYGIISEEMNFAVLVEGEV